MRIAGAMAALAVLIPAHSPPSPTISGIGYICAAERRAPAAAPRRLVKLSGMGSGGFTVRAGTVEAQEWLNYGLKLYHAFYHEDAKAAFARAAELDPDCALCAWGQALGLGPTLNFAVSDEETAKALALATRAAALARTPLERDLSAAMARRYAPGSTPEARGRAYADEMTELARRYPDEPDIADLAAHALLVPTRQGDRSGVPGAMTLLERALARDPKDTAAIHYYIHASEYAGRPADAVPYAERLADLAPNASHLVHMAAHSLFHIGRYEEVALVNARAINVDSDYAQTLSYQGPLGAPQYYAHNLFFGVFGALMAGDRELSLRYADHARVAFPEGAEPVRRTNALARTMVAYGRFAPRKALALPAPPDSEPGFHHIYWRYARGEALAALGDADGVMRESRAIEKIAVPETGGIAELRLIAGKVLAGRAAMMKGDPAAAAALYAEAATVQEKAFADLYDPPPWWYPVRRSLAAARLKAGDYRTAADEARKSLAAWPADGLALRVLSDAERRLGDRGAAEAHRAEATRAWRGGPEPLSLDLI